MALGEIKSVFLRSDVIQYATYLYVKKSRWSQCLCDILFLTHNLRDKYGQQDGKRKNEERKVFDWVALVQKHKEPTKSHKSS